MKRSTNGILTTHQGSLPRPQELLEMLVAMEADGKPNNPKAFEAAVQRAVAEMVKREADTGIAVINDGEMSKYSYSLYVKDRLMGIEGQSTTAFAGNAVYNEEFPEFVARRGP